MNQQPDKLFRDKLENYQPTVPPSAWDRIAASQDKKKPNRSWLKFAASLLLIAGAGTTWLLFQPASPVSTLAKKSAPSGTSKPAPQSESNLVPSTDPVKNELAVAATPSIQPKTQTETSARNNGEASPKAATPKVVNRQASPGPKAERANQLAAESSSNGIAMRNTADSGEAIVTTSISSEGSPIERPETTAGVHAISGSVAATKSVTLSYTTADVSAYLDKNIDDEATDDDKKQSTLKKLLQKANDLKTNQDPFGELRQRKNEILALNFKSDKRGQKTRN